jgi:hypothetical protein
VAEIHRRRLAQKSKASDPKFDFEMVYWADHLYKNHLHQDQKFYFDQRFNNEPYEEAAKDTLKLRKDGFFDQLAAKTFDIAGESLDLLKSKFGFDSLADAFLEQTVRLEYPSLTKLDIGPIFRSFSLNIPDIRLK